METYPEPIFDLQIAARLKAPGACAELMSMHIPDTAPATHIRTDIHNIVMITQFNAFRGQLRCTEIGITEFQPATAARFRPAGLKYEWQRYSGNFSFLSYGFSTDRLRQALDDEILLSPEEIQRGLDLVGSNVVPLLGSLLSELSTPGMGSAMFVDALSTVIIVELMRYLRNGETPRAEGGGLSKAQLDRIRERTEAEVNTPTVYELAQLCGMSERNLLRLFKATRGETISCYVRRVQMQKARRYLAGTDLPLKEVAFRLGFSQTSSFIQAFRRLAHDTPASYRKRVRRN